MSDKSPSPLYNGRYELRRQIARGGTAQVYLAHDLLLDRPVALKVLFPELSADHSFVQRFRREAQAAANLSHPNIVPIFDWGEAESTYFIVMEFVNGEPLSAIIRNEAPLSAGRAASIGAEIAKALTYAHRHGVVHRDVKPGNVLITEDGQVKVTDFGIARAIGADEQVTQTGLVMGTATYFSPEQAQGHAVDGRSDIYSLGVVLFEMATGKPPFGGDNPVSIAYQHVRESPPTPRSLNPAISPAFESVIQQAMAKSPADRYASAEELRADLDRLLAGQNVAAKSPVNDATMLLQSATSTTALPTAGAAAPPPSGPGRRRSTTPFWASAAVVLAVAIAAIVYFGGRSLGYFGTATYFRVPDVQGLTKSVAISRLDAVNLRHQAKPVEAADGKAGRVVRQSPGSPTKVRAGSLVLLYIGEKAATAPVPDVRGLSLQAAEAALKAKHFKSRVVQVSATDPSQKQNEVIKQDPAPNETKHLNSTVTLDVVSSAKLVVVPAVSGMNEIEAGAALTKAHLDVAAPKFVFSNTVPANQIVDSDPPSGEKVPPSTEVTLSVSRGPGVNVPNVIGDSLEEAEALLTENGLTYAVGPSYPSNPGLVGNVAFTSPAAGQMVAQGASVQLRVGRPPVTPGNSGTTGTTGTSGTAPPGSSGTSGTVSPGFDTRSFAGHGWPGNPEAHHHRSQP